MRKSSSSPNKLFKLNRLKKPPIGTIKFLENWLTCSEISAVYQVPETANGVAHRRQFVIEVTLARWVRLRPLRDEGQWPNITWPAPLRTAETFTFGVSVVRIILALLW